jgi:hypothetical protein
MQFLKSAPLGAAIAALVFLLSNCGGGGGNPVSGVITPAAPLRADLLFGYYGGCPTCALEQGGHVNLYWAGNLYGLPATMEELFQARAAGIQNIVLAVPAYSPNAELEVRFYLKRLQEAGLLVNIRALYPLDEPDLPDHAKSAEEIRATNAMLRRVVADFPELAGVKLAVIYAPTRVNGTWPGVETYDWVGFDDYDNRERIFTIGEYDALKRVLRDDQRILLVPGGAVPWVQDPAAFLAKAESDLQVIAIVAFIWQDLTTPGIRSTGVRRLYCEAGKTITNPAAPPTGC